MATIKTKELKNGEFSDTIQVKVDNKFISKTIRRPKDIRTKNEIERYFNRVSSEFEDSVRTNVFERKENITFAEVAEQWHKRSFGKDSKSYYYASYSVIEYLNKFIGNKLVKNVSATDVENILFKLNTGEFEISKAVLIKSVDDIIEKMKIKNICINGGFSKKLCYNELDGRKK